ncbi:LmbE-like protein, partial [Mycena pura]
ERALLLTAHPDDETFFFSPTLTALSRMQKVGKLGDIVIVCLSTGNAKGLGDVRREEFEKALDVFGIGVGRRLILDHPDLRDSKSVAWDPATIAGEVLPIVKEYRITTILTFDTYGITGHPNHQSALAGAAHIVFKDWPLLSTNTRPRLFTLFSQSTSFKYIGPLAASSLQLYPYVKGPVFIASFVDYVTALCAMIQHPSQLHLLGFSKGLFSRYLWVNEWIEV